jgi:hypothetical protein
METTEISPKPETPKKLENNKKLSDRNRLLIFISFVLFVLLILYSYLNGKVNQTRKDLKEDIKIVSNDVNKTKNFIKDSVWTKLSQHERDIKKLKESDSLIFSKIFPKEQDKKIVKKKRTRYHPFKIKGNKADVIGLKVAPVIHDFIIDNNLVSSQDTLLVKPKKNELDFVSTKKETFLEGNPLNAIDTTSKDIIPEKKKNFFNINGWKPNYGKIFSRDKK